MQVHPSQCFGKVQKLYINVSAKKTEHEPEHFPTFSRQTEEHPRSSLLGYFDPRVVASQMRLRTFEGVPCCITKATLREAYSLWRRSRSSYGTRLVWLAHIFRPRLHDPCRCKRESSCPRLYHNKRVNSSILQL